MKIQREKGAKAPAVPPSVHSKWPNHGQTKQVTRGHNIVADGWAGASNPHPHPNQPPTLRPTQKVSKTLVFPLFNSMTPYGPTDRRTDKGSYRVACPQLKNPNSLEIRYCGIKSYIDPFPPVNPHQRPDMHFQSLRRNVG